MAGGRRGLVAPQNTFLENIVRRSNGKDEDCYGALNRGISAVKLILACLINQAHELFDTKANQLIHEILFKKLG